MAKPRVWTPAKRERISEWISYWIRMLALEPVNVDTDFHEEAHTDDADIVTALDIQAAFPYRAMKIRVFPVMAGESTRRVAQRICHELIHYVVKPMSRNRLEDGAMFREFEEQCVDQLAMCFENVVHALDQERLKRQVRALRKSVKKRNAVR
jgi:hypothetical protein